jgi:hypothetical protein
VANWRQLYAASLLNTNSDLFELVADEASRAMNFRLGELRDRRGVAQELQEIALAAKSLLVMRAAWEESKLGRRSQNLTPSGEKQCQPKA